MEKTVNFDLECSVFIIGRSNKDNKELGFRYERPQIISDQELTNETNIIFEDMKSKRLMDVDELLMIYIARDKKQLSQMPNVNIVL